MDETRARALLERALDFVLERDRILIENRVGERCVGHRLAVYMEELLRHEELAWSVDCEYDDMNGGDPKWVDTLAGQPRRSGGVRTGFVVPDIIVHRRGPDGPNLIAVELKWIPNSFDEDLLKLRGYRDRLNYANAFLIRIAADRNGCELINV